MKRKKKIIISLFHSLYISGIAYAALRFLQTPRHHLFPRRLWAYEIWIIIGFYTIFLILTSPDFFNDK